MSTDPAVAAAANQLELVLTEQDSSHVPDLLVERINELIESDFSRLISILYRQDISEIKLRQLLKENRNTDAAKVIADMMIEREREKINSRQTYQGAYRRYKR